MAAVQFNCIMYGRRTIMEEAKLTIRIPRNLLENVKQKKTITKDLILKHLYNIPSLYPFENAPIVRRLSGTLSQNVNIQDYKKHLEEKFNH